MGIFNKILLILSLLAVYSVYFISSSDINCSNDGGHYGLAKAIYYDHQLSIDKYLGTYITKPDYAVKDNKSYSDRLPGTALLIVPYFFYTKLLIYIGLPAEYNNHELNLLIASQMPALFGMLSVLLLFIFFYKLFKFSFHLSLIASLIFAFGTLAWLESSHLFSHAPSLFFASTSFYIAIVAGSCKNWKTPLLLTSILIGTASLIEFQNVLFIVPIFLYICFKHNLIKNRGYSEIFKNAFLCAFIILIFLTLLLTYNYLAFHDITFKSNKYNPFFPEEQSFFSSLSGNFFRGIDLLYTSFSRIYLYFDWSKGTSNKIPGLFIASPVLIISAVGYKYFYKKYKHESLLFLTAIIIDTLICAFHKTTLTRHIYSVTMLLFIPYIFALKHTFNQEQKVKKYFAALIIALTSISVIRIFYITFNYFRKQDFPIFYFKDAYPVFLVSSIPVFIIIILYVFSKKWDDSDSKLEINIK